MILPLMILPIILRSLPYQIGFVLGEHDDGGVDAKGFGKLFGAFLNHETHEFYRRRDVLVAFSNAWNVGKIIEGKIILLSNAWKNSGKV